MADDAGLWTGDVILTTARLRLRLFLAADLPHYAKLNADPEVMAYLGGPMTEAQSDGIARGAQRAFLRSGIGKIAVERQSDGAFIGMCGLSFEPWYPDEVEIGWRLGRAFWGRAMPPRRRRPGATMGFRILGSSASSRSPRTRTGEASLLLPGWASDHRAELAEGNSSFEAVIFSLTHARWQEQRRQKSP